MSLADGTGTGGYTNPNTSNGLAGTPAPTNPYNYNGITYGPNYQAPKVAANWASNGQGSYNYSSPDTAGKEAFIAGPHGWQGPGPAPNNIGSFGGGVSQRMLNLSGQNPNYHPYAGFTANGGINPYLNGQNTPYGGSTSGTGMGNFGGNSGSNAGTTGASSGTNGTTDGGIATTNSNSSMNFAGAPNYSYQMGVNPQSGQPSWNNPNPYSYLNNQTQSGGPMQGFNNGVQYG